MMRIFEHRWFRVGCKPLATRMTVYAFTFKTGKDSLKLGAPLNRTAVNVVEFC